MGRVVPSWLVTRLANWRAGVFAALVVAIGLTLNLTVLGANPVAKLASSAPPEVEQASAAVEAVPPGTAVVVDVEVPAVPTDVVVADSVAEPTPTEDLGTSAPAAIAPTASPARTQPSAITGVAAVPAPVPSGAPALVIAAAPTTVPRVPAAVAPTTSAPRTVAPTTVAPTTSPPTTSPPTTPPPTTSPPTTTAPAPIEYLTYTVSGGVGDVVLARQGNSISLYGFYPNSGWVREVESNGPGTVKLKFFNVQTQQDREWKATLEGGRIQVEN